MTPGATLRSLVLSLSSLGRARDDPEVVEGSKDELAQERPVRPPRLRPLVAASSADNISCDRRSLLNPVLHAAPARQPACPESLSRPAAVVTAPVLGCSDRHDWGCGFACDRRYAAGLAGFPTPRGPLAAVLYSALSRTSTLMSRGYGDCEARSFGLFRNGLSAGPLTS